VCLLIWLRLVLKKNANNYVVVAARWADPVPKLKYCINCITVSILGDWTCPWS
jgi:hypothetical protein